LSRKDFIPAYLPAFEEGLLQQRTEEAIESLRSCRLCPRDCEIKAETERRFAHINRSLDDSEFEQALERARPAGWWRFDARWSRHAG
jgi:putative pyruvate formate lyase activating enzyme